MSFFSKIRGTIESLFSIGIDGPQIKNNAGIIEFRDDTDAAFVIARGLAPVGDNDLVTKKYHDDNNASANGLTIVKMPLALATKVSTAAIPNNAIISWAVLDVTTAYDTASPTFEIERTGDATVVVHGTSDSNLKKIGQYEVPQVTDWGVTGLGTVTATLTGSPTVGAADIYIAYSIPTDIS
jgi:hypothetical protein